MEFQFFLGFLHLILMVSVYAMGQQSQQCSLGDTSAFIDTVKALVVVFKEGIDFFHVLFKSRKALVLLSIGSFKDLHQFYQPVCSTAESRDSTCYRQYRSYNFNRSHRNHTPISFAQVKGPTMPSSSRPFAFW